MPAGRLHAVSGDGLIARRAPPDPGDPLDPTEWAWPDDDAEEWPPCWTCLALTR